MIWVPHPKRDCAPPSLYPGVTEDIPVHENVPVHETPEDASRKATNPKDAAAHTDHRLDLSLFPATARMYGALALTEGDLKYGGYNWRVAGVRASVYYAAANRHLEKWWNGEECDPDTQVPHLANAIACLAVVIDAVEAQEAPHPLDPEAVTFVDDRPPRLPLRGLVARCGAIIKHLRERFNPPAKRYTQLP